MPVEVVNPASFPGWDEWIVERAGCSIFHSSAWCKVLQRSYGYEPRYFTWMENGMPQAVIPMVEVNSSLTGRRGVSLSFSDYCEPLVDDPQLFDNLFDRIVEYARTTGWQRIEMRGGSKYLSNVPASATYLGHIVPLDKSEQELLSSLRGNTRWSIRRSVLEGVHVTIDTALHSLKEFYRLHCMTRKHHGTPPQPFSFFRNIYDCVLSKDQGHVVLASHNNRNIAGAVCFNSGCNAMYKYSASDSRYNHLCANNLVLWEAIKYYSGEGKSSLCLGRTDSDNEGLRKFKTGWGTQESSLSYYLYDIKKSIFVTGNSSTMSMYTKILARLPESILKVVGKILYRHIG